MTAEFLVQHLRDAENRPFATITIDKGRNVGWAICAPKDSFNRKMGVKIAAGRMNAGSTAVMPTNRYVLIGDRYVNAIYLMQECFTKMNERAARYYK